MRQTRFFHALRRFQKDQTGLLSAEAALMLPLLLWAHLGVFTFFDGFRTQNVAMRAAYTISDMLSRETDYVTPSYMNGLNDMLGLLTQSEHETMLRVSVVRYDEDEDDHILVWSAVDGGLADVLPLTDTTLESKLVPSIPVMADADSVIIVETWAAFMPIMNFGLDAFYMENKVVTRPRFAPQLLWEDA